MKRYYVEYWNNFGNTYNLYWAETPEQRAMSEKLGLERITRKKAFRLCAEENYRRKHDSSFAYFADNAIYPVDYDEEQGYLPRDGYVSYYERRRKSL